MLSTAIVCLALNVYHEARGESIKGQEAVAQVTLNRVESHRYPDNICDVVEQRKQFSWTHDSVPDWPKDKEAWETALRVAQRASEGVYSVDLDGSLHYHAKRVRPHWARGKKPVATIGNHIFYNDVR